MAVAAYGKEASPEAREDATASKLIAATEYQQSRVVVAGGGGLSIGGNFAIQGTIGQHDADPLGTLARIHLIDILPVDTNAPGER